MKTKFVFLMQLIRTFPTVILTTLMLAGAAVPSQAQSGLDSFDRENAKAMLSAVKDDLKKNYYDPGLRGLDIETHFKQAEDKLSKATTRDQLIIIVAQTLLELDDSHTFFMPPPRAARVQYGWEMKLIGDRVFVSEIKPQSDAEAAGLKAGDEILAVDGVRPTRGNIWKMYYRYYALMPSRSIRLQIKSPGGTEAKELNVPAKVIRTANVTDWGKIFVQFLRERKDIEQDRFVTVGKDLFIWEMSSFVASENHIDAMMGKARDFKTLIIDLRGNSGGYVKALERLAGYFFDHDVKISDEKGRKETKPSMAKTRGANGFKGEVIVLVDSESASASELFARLIQIEKRGKVIGDRTAGAVMISRSFDHRSGVGSVLYYGTSVTIADSVMSDGKSLEKIGVVPDVIMIPEAVDLAAKRDPVLSYAAKLAGVELDPEKAGSFFPKEWHE
ncbi:MAG TPA: S41 family peptidase [Pyrinomonadaceae bacterium]|nr:S41 family peptidase [Pyrinomonadaceae bacterium]